MRQDPCDFIGEDGHYHCPYADDNYNVSCRDMCGLGVDEDEFEHQNLEEFEEYTPSSMYGDYSPSCPWNAPGMSVSDFI